MKYSFFFKYYNHSFETRPGGSTWDPRLEPGRVEEKTGEEKTRYDPATRLKTRLQPVDFFFTKTMSF